MSFIQDWIDESYLHQITLDLFGLVALAHLSTIARRTALTGTSNLTDVLVLCPGLHRQQDAPNLAGGDYPWCAAMTTGYVFRIENEATVSCMQKVGRPGHLTTLVVSHSEPYRASWRGSITRLFDVNGDSRIVSLVYFSAIILSMSAMVLLYLLQDVFGLFFLGVLMLARLTNIIVIQRRAIEGWKGEPEPDKKSDLIVLLSQDRWIRLKGDVDDVKAITSGQWLREPTVVESACVAFATLMVYLDVAIAVNATHAGKIILIILLCSSAGFLGLANEYTKSFRMYGRTVTACGLPKRYQRRLLLTEELVKETGRGDWAFGLGMANQDDVDKFLSKANGTTGSPDKEHVTRRRTRAQRS